jgi:hypothetical protein
MTDSQDAATVVDALTPRVLHQGRYRLYEKSDGSLRIQYRRDDKDEDDFLEIPGAILRLAKLASEGKMNPLQAMKAMREGSFNGD